MGLVFCFCNQKGGVGKTTSVVNLSFLIANKGLKTLAIDLDPQGNLTSGIGVNKGDVIISSYDVVIKEDNNISKVLISNVYPNLDLLPALPDLAGAEIELVSQVGREFVLKNRLSEVVSKYDAIFIDCPPSLGLLTVNALTAANFLIVPLQCEYYALEGLGQLLNTFRLIKTKINGQLQIGGIILTMADTRAKSTAQVVGDVRQHFPSHVFQAIIPRAIRVSEAPSFGKPVVVYAPESKGAVSYRELAEEFYNRFFGRVKSTQEIISDPKEQTEEIKF